MTDESTVKAIRALTTATWALVIVLVLTALSHFLSAAFLSSKVSRPDGTLVGAAPTETSLNGASFRDKYEGFHDWPVEKQISSASAIVITKHRIEKDNLISTVSEVLKLDPGTDFYYPVNAEYKRSKTTKGTTYGDGEVVFFAGSPALMRYSVTCSAERCEGLGGIPLDKLRELITANVAQPAVQQPN